MFSTCSCFAGDFIHLFLSLKYVILKSVASGKPKVVF